MAKKDPWDWESGSWCVSDSDSSSSYESILSTALYHHDVDGAVWSTRVDGNLIKELNLRMPPFKLSSDKFIDILFQLPPKDLDVLFSFPQEEMFKRIFCYWKYLNEEREAPPSGQATSKKFKKKVRQVMKVMKVAPDKLASKGEGWGGWSDGSWTDQEEEAVDPKDVGKQSRGLKRRCKNQMVALEMADTLEPRPETYAGHGDGAVDESELELRTVVCQDPAGDVVPFNTPHHGRLSSAWNWVQQRFATRRSRRVVPAPQTLLNSS